MLRYEMLLEDALVKVCDNVYEEKGFSAIV